jgi:hypothetical protein
MGTQVRHRLYLTAVALAALFCAGVLAVHVVVRVHDYLVAKEDLACEERVWREERQAMRERNREAIARACTPDVLAEIEANGGKSGAAINCIGERNALPAEATARIERRCNITTGAADSHGFQHFVSKRAWCLGSGEGGLRLVDALVLVVALAPLVILLGVHRWLKWLTKPTAEEGS